MKKYYSDERLEEIFVQAKNNIFTRGLAIKLEQEMWRSQGQTADDLYNFLKLDKKGFYDLFEGPAVVTWVSYATKLGNLKEHPVQFVVISELEKRFNYLDLARMLDYASPRTREMKRLVTSLQKMQFEQWWTKKRWTPKQLESKLDAQDPKNAELVRLSFLQKLLLSTQVRSLVVNQASK
ncbi:hypothetical protein JG687_00019086 [Phytophthora cactorum]|uniref:RXLR phytopathogen effector protein WY-domain domain-containing protein n=1 Tax=Phytophthora cactorum TaxID=29920 RepID=A0A8T1TJJ9_9STRA|nr:hypothetical protein JG687_00019086 [Phytophthora cactorum]